MAEQERRGGWRNWLGNRPTAETAPEATPPAPEAKAAPLLKPVARGPVHDYADEAYTLSVFFDFGRDEVAKSVAECAAAPAGPVARIAWFVPNFESTDYGGAHTILRIAEHIRRTRGVTAVFVIIGATNADEMRARIAVSFPDLARACEVVCLERMNEYVEVEPVDAAVATMWMTAIAVLRLEGARRKFYFLQDWEPLFYPAGTTSALVESSFRFGFHAICNTVPLAESYRAYGGTASVYQPQVDPAMFHTRRPARRQGAPLSLFCYARPGKPRNCFEVLAGGLQEVKRQLRGGIDIVTAGAEWNPAEFGLGGVLRNLGLVPHEKMGDIYRAMDVGLVASASRHPSYLPFELMACGVAVVANRNPYTTWLLRDRENCLLFEMSRSDIADTIVELSEHVEMRRRLAEAGTATVLAGHADWDASCEVIADEIAAVCAAASTAT